MENKELFKKLDEYPELLDINDLINLGIYAHKNGAYRARKNGTSPNYVKMVRKILYPKESVRAFILARFKNGSIPML